MRPTLQTIALMAVVTTASGCADGVQIPEVRKAFDDVVRALEKKDAAALWSLSHPEAQEALLGLARDAASAASAARDLWGAAESPEGARARAALGGELTTISAVPEAERGARLVAHFVDLGALAWTEGSRESVSLARITVDASVPDLAVVRIPSGESMAFKTYDGNWRTLLLRDLVLDSERWKSLRANIDKTLALAEEQAQIWRTGLDAATPQGAFNLLRRELPKGADAAPFVYRLLDAPARDLLKEALEAGRAAQRRLQQGVPRAGRDAAYQEAGLADHVASRTDLDLFARWYKRHPLSTGLADDLPERFERDGAERGTLITKSGQRLPMTRDPGGTWSLSGLTEPLRAALLTPLLENTPPENPPDNAPPGNARKDAPATTP